MRITNNIKQSMQRLQPSSGKAEEAKKPGNFKKSSIKSLDGSSVRKNLFSLFKASGKALSERLITKPSQSEVRPVMNSQTESSEEALDRIQGKIKTENQKRSSQPEKNHDSLKSRVTSAKKSLDAAKPLQKESAKIAKDAQLSQNLTEHGLSNHQPSDLEQKAIDVHGLAKSLVDKRKSEFKTAEKDFETFTKAADSKTKIIKNANSLIKTLNTLTIKEKPPKDGSLKSLEKHLGRLTTTRQKLKAVTRFGKKLLKDIPGKEKKHGYTLPSVSAGLIASNNSVPPTIKRLEAEIIKFTLLIKKEKLNKKQTVIDKKQTEIARKLNRFESIPKIKRQAPQPPALENKANIKTPVPNKRKRQAPQPPALENMANHVSSSSSINPEYDPIKSINYYIEFGLNGPHENPHVTEDDLILIESQIKDAMNNVSVNNESLDNLFNNFRTALNQHGTQGEETLYHDRSALLTGFAKGLELLKKESTHLEAQKAFYDTLRSSKPR